MKAMVIIPTYNERDNIERLTNEILALGQDIHILIVDDNSPDKTGEIADDLVKRHENLHVIHRAGKMGLGSAYIEGFKYALKAGAEKIIEMDADFSHNPERLPALIEKADEADLVIGSRYLNGVSVVNWPIRRLMLSYFANMYTRIITGLEISDCTGGFKCFNRKVLESIDLDKIRADGYSFQIEMNYRCVENGFSIDEIPIIFIDRHAGTSKMSKKIVREAVFMVWRLRIGSIFNRLMGKKHA